jgi:hypothetical protein
VFECVFESRFELPSIIDGMRALIHTTRSKFNIFPQQSKHASPRDGETGQQANRRLASTIQYTDGVRRTPPVMISD